ncbi:hypothetical protein [Streptomyces sp. NPDC005485]|uniref:tetratricopeptide repeat protein n=1 Tax=Streptomyces sp. NPDC005485 TaxID=3155591 RepID=UPI0033B419C0
MLELEEQPSWLAWCPPWLAAVAIAVLGVVGAGGLEQWAARRQTMAEEEYRAVDRLRQHLGRQERLPRIGAGGADGLMLRVHEAIPPDPPVQPTTAAQESQRAGWLHRRRQPMHQPQLGPDPYFPVFVERDAGERVRTWMGTASREGGFLVLVGNSSVGKTRLLYESARKELPDFAVLAPDLGDGGLVNTLASVAFPLPKLLVWLDELQRFLPGPYHVTDEQANYSPLSAAAVRKLLTADTPVVIVGTLWPQYATELRGSESATAPGGQRPRYPAAMDILSSAAVTEIPLESFSRTERSRAATLAARDSRLARAVADTDYNVTEALAGAPQIMRRYQQATDLNKTIIHAAVDARRLGIQAPLSTDLLRAAARGYLTSVQPDDSWFDQALAELTSTIRRDDRATAPLIIIPTADHRGVRGLTVADFLLQDLVRQRRSIRVPSHTWHAFIDHVTDYDDRWRLADSARRRLLPQKAQALYTILAPDDPNAATRLAALLAERGDIDALRAGADAGDRHAARALVELLLEQGNLDEAKDILRARVDADDSYAARRLARLLIEHGDVGEAMDMLRTRADAGDFDAVGELAALLAQQGDVDALQARADAGDRHAARQLTGVLAKRGDLDALRTRADVGDFYAAGALAELLTGQGDVHEASDVLRARADAGDRAAAGELARLLARQGDVDELRVRADAGDSIFARRLASLLFEQGNQGEAIDILRARADVGDGLAAAELAKLHAKQGDTEALRARADAGDRAAADQLDHLLAEQSDLSEAIVKLRARADAGDTYAIGLLPELLIRHGDIDEAIQLLRAHDRVARNVSGLAWLLAEKGDTEMAIHLLRTFEDSPLAAHRLAQLLVEENRIDEAIDTLTTHADAGDSLAADDLVKLLAREGNIDRLYDEVHAGTHGADQELISFLAARGEPECAERLRIEGFDAEDPV